MISFGQISGKGFIGVSEICMLLNSCGWTTFQKDWKNEFTVHQAACFSKEEFVFYLPHLRS